MRVKGGTQKEKGKERKSLKTTRTNDISGLPSLSLFLLIYGPPARDLFVFIVLSVP